jgi:Ca2+/H+ antiporter
LERITDAEAGAVALLDENAEIYNQARLAMSNIAMLQGQLSKARRGSIIGFSIGGVSFGVGAPLVVEGIRQDNTALLWSGVGTIGVGALVWSLGHFVFYWW